jgi:hypothetical protein
MPETGIADTGSKTGLKGSAVKALRRAQGQLLQAQKRALLFFAADILFRLKDFIPQDMQDRISPLTTYAGAEKRDALIGFEIGEKLKQTRDALAELAARCAERAKNPLESPACMNAFRILSSTVFYLDMANRISEPRQDGIVQLHRFLTVDPAVTARFIADYIPLLAVNFQNTGVETELMNQRSRLLNFLPGPDGKAADTEALMSCLSAAGDLFLQISKDINVQAQRGTRTSTALEFLFQTAAVYDWQQHETRSAAPMQRAKIIGFTPRQ